MTNIKKPTGEWNTGTGLNGHRKAGEWNCSNDSAANMNLNRFNAIDSLALLLIDALALLLIVAMVAGILFMMMGAI